MDRRPPRLANNTPTYLPDKTQMDTVQEQFQAMAIDAVEDNQDQDEDEETMYASVDEFGCLATRQSVPSPTLTKISQCNAQSET
ncbi:MAG: hypothetical protein J3R72DRAFT_522487 [Linnemannia gamsii]|nr:MAG: hypothetical protein J3R72DRAFT_522487 [Linnemannia gamsii]